MNLDKDFDYRATGTFYAVIIPKQHTPNNQEIEAGSFNKELALEILKKQKSDFWYGKIGDIFFIILFSVIFLPLGIGLFIYWYFKGAFQVPYFNVKNNVTRPIYEHELSDAKKWGLTIEKIEHNEEEFEDNTEMKIEPVNNESFNAIKIQSSSLVEFTDEFYDWYEYLKYGNIIEAVTSNEFVTFKKMYDTYDNYKTVTNLYAEAFDKGYFLAEYIINYDKYITKTPVNKNPDEVFKNSINEVLILEERGIIVSSFLDDFFHQFIKNDIGSNKSRTQETHRDEIWEFSREQMLLGIITRFTEFKYFFSNNKVELNGMKMFQRKYPDFLLERIFVYLTTSTYESLYKEQEIEAQRQKEDELNLQDLIAFRDYLKEEGLTSEEFMQELNEIQNSLQTAEKTKEDK